MIEKKAKPTGIRYREKYQTFVEYEYRGEKYEVEFANAMNYLVTSPKVQHENAQAEIDERLDRPQRESREEDKAEYGFELFWEYVEGEGE
jgi:hypothetical protein